MADGIDLIPAAQKFKGMTRPPRVHIQYEIKTGQATEKVNLPFVMGVLGDYSGKRDPSDPPVGERRFVDADMYTFDNLFQVFKPTVEFTVPNVMGGGGDLKVKQTFKNLKDFTPAGIASGVDGLKEMFAIRKALDSLATKAQSLDEVEKKLKELMGENQEFLKAVAEAKAEEAKVAEQAKDQP